MNELTPDEHRILVDVIHDSATVIHKGQRMNNRIRELAEQCYQIEDPHGRFPKEVFNQEKFAELIVRECIEVVDNRSKKNFHPTSFGGELLHYVTTDLKQHFGVEE